MRPVVWARNDFRHDPVLIRCGGPVMPGDVGEAGGAGHTRRVNSSEAGKQRSEKFDRLVEAAYQAEFATGPQELTREAAKRHIVIRLATIAVGSVVLLGGLVMMVLPGPGIVGILAGLGILARELPWAERMVEYVKKRAKIDQLKQQPKWVQIVMWSLTIVATVASLLYVFVWR
jgi:uncharacterized protein (TIGR02611 family)